MKKIAKIFAALVVFLAVPTVASFGVMALWNGIITSVCGFAVITYWQAVGLILYTVIAPLEEAINGVEGINYMTSLANNNGQTTVSLITY